MDPSTCPESFPLTPTADVGITGDNNRHSQVEKHHTHNLPHPRPVAPKRLYFYISCLCPRRLTFENFWRREQLPTPVFWPGEFHGLYSP